MNTQPSQHTTEPTAAADAPASGRQRRFAVLGVTAGLLGGAAIGLLAASPSFSSAAGVSNAVSATVIDDTTTDETTDLAERPDPSVRLRESLQTLVDDGTITAAQADAVATHLGTLRGEMGGHAGGHAGGHRGGVDGDVIAEALGLEAADVRTALADGSTIAELAEASGVDVQVVIEALVAAANERIDLAVTDGKVTEEEAATKRADVTTRITELVDREITFGGRGPRGGGHGFPADTPADTESTG
ncbi:MAG TPA: hypothetical protein VMM60_11675 [Ilumatobacter sp.]|nr:hypothetical protein [Ilumatobacter sp.]